jgi:predicted histidine transporter YuiF (NhaC family)
VVIQEQYTPQPMAANASFVTTNQRIGGFICITSGTLTVTDGTGMVEVNGVPVTAGVYLPLPIFLGNNGATITLAGGASGTLLI